MREEVARIQIPGSPATMAERLTRGSSGNQIDLAKVGKRDLRDVLFVDRPATRGAASTGPVGPQGFAGISVDLDEATQSQASLLQA